MKAGQLAGEVGKDLRADLHIPLAKGQPSASGRIDLFKPQFCGWTVGAC